MILPEAYYIERDKKVHAIIAEHDALMAQDVVDWTAITELTREMRGLVGLPEAYGEAEHVD